MLTIIKIQNHISVFFRNVPIQVEQFPEKNDIIKLHKTM